MMHNLSNKDSDQTSVHSTSHGGVNCTSWWNSSGSHIPKSSLSTGLKLNGEPAQRCNQIQPLGLQVQDQDSSSTQSTGQSHQDMVGMSGGNLHGRSISVQSGNDGADGKRIEGKSVLSLGTPDFAFPPSQIDYSQSMACIPYPYADPSYLSGVLAAYPPQAVVHPQLMGIAPARVPLPHDVMQDEPIYVNAKQYRAILRRRQLRAKLEAQNKLIKGRKPYLHESRHKHAMNRARGNGGRFLNTKNSTNQSNSRAKGQNSSDSTQLQLGGSGMLESEGHPSENGNHRGTSTTTTSCSDVSSVSNNENMVDQAGHRFSGFRGSGVIMRNGPHRRVPVMQ
ncbi:Nuclear transcription factor Y subunit A-3 [Acorus calamus]|uniref:Nuclear transcription factor Y subunit n=1 Tax=Acorus calamus TaxID=4465 RepID=A0AAV9CGF4_ACOCL|nr:Nuclear transcription factor Y subunit A-3 [Acorus calamus]